MGVTTPKNFETIDDYELKFRSKLWYYFLDWGFICLERVLLLTRRFCYVRMSFFQTNRIDLYKCVLLFSRSRYERVKEGDSISPASLVQGMLVAAKYSGNWFRAKITALYSRTPFLHTVVFPYYIFQF